MENSSARLNTYLLLILACLLGMNITGQPLNNWLDFDGTNDYVDFGNSALLKPTDSLTVELWAGHSLWSTLDNASLISNSQGGGYSIWADDGSIIGILSLGGTYLTFYPLDSLEGGWHHFALTCDGRYIKMYVDGNLADSVDTEAENSIYYNSSTPVLIASNGPNGMYFNGMIDEVRIWSTQRSQLQLEENKDIHINPGTDGLSGYWQLNETSGITAIDSSANGNNGTLMNMTGNEWTPLFKMTSTSFPGIAQGSVAWGDYDNDGDLDILMSGNSSSASQKIYVNNGNGTFSNSGITLIYLQQGTADWGDYNNDGFLDILMTGDTGSEWISKVYRNNGNGTFTDMAVLLTGVYRGSCAWGDYDDDGYLDILLTGESNTGYISEVYKNNQDETFSIQTSIALPGIVESSVAWGDYDNDDDLDILLAGYNSTAGNISRIYRNNGNGTFSNSGIPLTGVSKCAVAWGDYDNDGFPDILLTGETASSEISKIYQNNQDGTFSEQTGIDLPAITKGAVAWGDYDNDGDLDILMTGMISGSFYNSFIFRNDGDAGFVEQTDIALTGVNESDVAWGDYDNDGDLDILLAGIAGSIKITKVFKNNIIVSNTAPAIPVNLTHSAFKSGVTLDWTASTDDETASPGLGYNVYLRKIDETQLLGSPMADTSTGWRRVPAMGNARQNTSCAFKNLPPGEYDWRVQAIDQAFMGSDFSPAESFVLYGVMDSVPGFALNFDGVNDYVSIADDASLNSNSFTVELWLKPDALGVQHLVTKKNPGGGDLYWRIFMANANGTIEFDALPGEIANCTASNVAVTGEWLHIAAVYDHLAQTVKLYANGELKGNVTGQSNMGGGSNKGLYFSNASSSFDGKIDEVRYWNVARTQQEIRENMHRTLTGYPVGLVSYWQMNDTNGAVVKDSYWTNTGELLNMTTNVWEASTVATGKGISNTQTEQNGAVVFTATGLTIDYSVQNGAQVTVTRIDTAANVNPSGNFDVFNSQYWVVNRYGTGAFDADLTFTLSEDLSSRDEAMPADIRLFTRSSIADTSWALLTQASSVNAANKQATFENITAFSQFILARYVYGDISVTADTLDYGIVNVGSSANQSFFIKNFGNDTLVINDIANNASVFSPDITQASIAPDDSVNVIVSFSPLETRVYLDTLTISSNDPDEPSQEIVLSGEGLISNKKFVLDSIELIMENFNDIDMGSNSHPCVIDVDNDGLLDLLIGGYYGNIAHYEQSISDSDVFDLVTANFCGIDVGEISKPAIIDLDGDTLLDMIIGEFNGKLYHYEQAALNSTSFLLLSNNFNGIDVGNASAPTFTDLDGDGLLDMIIGESDGSLNHYEQDTPNSSSFTLATVNFNGIDVGIYSMPVFTDLEGDGLLDLLIGSDAGMLYLYNQSATNSNTFSYVTNQYSGIANVTRLSLAITDLNDDGVPDIIAGNFWGNLLYYKQATLDTLNLGACFSGASLQGNYTLVATDLEGDLDISCPDGISVSLSEDSGFVQHLSVEPQSGRIFKEIYLHFEPGTSGIYNESILHSDSVGSDKLLPVNAIVFQSGFPVSHCVGSALEFNGTDNYVTTSLDDLSGSEITIEFWFKGSELGSAFCQRANNSFIYLDQNKNVYLSNDGGTGFGLSIGSGAEDGDWHHIAVTWKQNTAMGFKTYLDGMISYQRNSNNIPLPDIGSPLLFGFNQEDSVFINGQLDEVRIWSVALTQNQIRENMHRTLTGNEAGLVTYWQMNEGSGKYTVDYIGENIATLENMDEGCWVNSEALWKYWEGGLDTCWTTGGNWSTSFSAPTVNDMVRVISVTNQPHITNNPGAPAECLLLKLESGTILTIDIGKALNVQQSLILNAGANVVIQEDAAVTVEAIEEGEICE